MLFHHSLPFSRLYDGTLASLQKEPLLQKYLELLQQWGATHNFIAHRELETTTLWKRHFHDSASLFPCIEPFDELTDIGSGAGLPGIVLAIMTKIHGCTRVCHLVEPRLKRAAFLQHIVTHLQLPAVVHTARIENLKAIVPSVFVSRAFSSLEQTLHCLKMHWTPQSSYICLKGLKAAKEITIAREQFNFNLEVFQGFAHPDSRVLHLSKLEVVE